MKNLIIFLIQLTKRNGLNVPNPINFIHPRCKEILPINGNVAVMSVATDNNGMEEAPTLFPNIIKKLQKT